MKKLFKEFYFKDLNFKNLDDKTVVIFDANTLLHIYRYSQKATLELFNSIQSVKKNIWLPYQVALEFHRNRQNVRRGIVEEKKNIINKSEEVFKSVFPNMMEILSNYNIRSIDSIKTKQEVEKDLEEQFNIFFSDTILKKYEEYLDLIDSKDDQLDNVLKIFEGKVGAPFSKEDLIAIQKEGENRYKNKIPPGYKDKSKTDYTYHGENYQLENKYSDLIYWKEIIRFAKENALSNVVIVSDDMKEDWIYETKGKKIGARIELKKELMDEADCNLLIIGTNKFIELTSGKDNKWIIENNEVEITMDSLQPTNTLFMRQQIYMELSECKYQIEDVRVNLLGMGIQPPSIINEYRSKINHYFEKLEKAFDIVELEHIMDDLYMIKKELLLIKKELKNILV